MGVTGDPVGRIAELAGFGSPANLCLHFSRPPVCHRPAAL
jgi:hypothetical protein